MVRYVDDGREIFNGDLDEESGKKRTEEHSKNEIVPEPVK